MAETLQNPGSFVEFEKRGEFEGDASEAYGAAVEAHRKAIAAALGVTAQELHDGGRVLAQAIPSQATEMLPLSESRI